MKTTTIVTMWQCAVLLSCGALFAASPAASANEQSDAAISILKSANASDHDKAQACLDLAVWGDASCVPVLAELLDDPTFSCYARYGLQANPSPEAAGALRTALDRLEGDLLVGVIDSLGSRDDNPSAKKIGGLLVSHNRQVAIAAAGALAKIGGDVAMKQLQAVSSPLPLDLVDPALEFADRLAKQGRANDAKEIYDKIYQSEAPEHLRKAAAYGLIRLTPFSDAEGSVQQLLASEVDWRFETGLQAAQRSDRPEATRLLARAVKEASPLRQQILLTALDARGDRAAVQAARDATSSDEPAVRNAAIAALGALGGPSDVPSLVKMANDADPATCSVARSSLTRIEADNLEETLIGMLESPDDASIMLAMEIIGRRRFAAAGPALLDAAKQADRITLRLAALESLKRLAAAELLSQLLDHASAVSNEEEGTLAAEAAIAAAMRARDRAAAVKMIAARISPGQPERNGLLFKAVNVVGGPQALELVSAAARGSDRDLQDEATKTLGNWRTADAAPVLLQIASSENPFRIRALRGYLRVARQLNVDEKEKVAMCRRALDLASRPSERLLVLEVLGRTPTVDSLKLTLTLLPSNLGSEAGDTAVGIAEKLKRQHPKLAVSAAREVVESGADGDVLERARRLMGGNG